MHHRVVQCTKGYHSVPQSTKLCQVISTLIRGASTSPLGEVLVEVSFKMVDDFLLTAHAQWGYVIDENLQQLYIVLTQPDTVTVHVQKCNLRQRIMEKRLFWVPGKSFV